ncbi:methyltransferase [Actinomadura kijaniata]|uniref:SAM-dependent methyltransferase n=1 Tax=Actinomadura namibiensis TaxID=182080 RepID=A0A7W3LRP5_ACTNM|nr:methyltransferase [Actinomadura namibiensis]MBA8953049.1 SAM-dependent methyltransferase [Actinomadura namibiensis]
MDDLIPPGPETEPPAADVLAQMAQGLLVSQTLVAAEDLDLFTFLSAKGAATVAEVAAGVGVDERPAEIVLTACAALGLVERDGAGFRNTPVADHYLVRGRPYFFGDYIRMLRDHAFTGWMRVTEAVRSNRPSRWTAEQREDIFTSENRAKLFWDGLYPLSAVTARALGEAVDLGGVTRLLDVGGGGAAFDIELCRRYPGLRATVYDLPHVCEHAAERIGAAGLSERVSPHPGDFFADEELPDGHDAILLSMIMHDWDEARNRELLGKCFRALPRGGLLVISELLVDDDRTGPLDAALMSLNMLVATWGRNYTAGEYGDWLRAAGFDDVRTVRFRAPGANGAVLARKP